MEDLFWTTLSIDGKEERYHIIFENEEYCFIPKDASLATYKFSRGHDEEFEVEVDDAAVEVEDVTEDDLILDTDVLDEDEDDEDI